MGKQIIIVLRCYSCTTPLKREKIQTHTRVYASASAFAVGINLMKEVEGGRPFANFGSSLGLTRPRARYTTTGARVLPSIQTKLFSHRARLLLLLSCRQNEDIDIALDNCTGVAFAEMVNAYLKLQGQDEGKIGVIEVRGCVVSKMNPMANDNEPTGDS